MKDKTAMLPESYAAAPPPWPVARDWESLTKWNGMWHPGQPLQRVGLCLVLSDFDDEGPGFRWDWLLAHKEQLLALEGVTIRGCSVRGGLEGVHGERLGRFFRAGYESTKQLSVLLPCAIPFLRWEGVVDAVEQNRLHHPETLPDALRAAEIIAMQNATAFYAKLLID